MTVLLGLILAVVSSAPLFNPVGQSLPRWCLDGQGEGYQPPVCEWSWVESKVSNDEQRIRDSGQMKVWMTCSSKCPLFVGSLKKPREQSGPVQLIPLDYQIFVF